MREIPQHWQLSKWNREKLQSPLVSSIMVIIIKQRQDLNENTKELAEKKGKEKAPKQLHGARQGVWKKQKERSRSTDEYIDIHKLTELPRAILLSTASMKQRKEPPSIRLFLFPFECHAEDTRKSAELDESSSALEGRRSERCRKTMLVGDERGNTVRLSFLFTRYAEFCCPRFLQFIPWLRVSWRGKIPFPGISRWKFDFSEPYEKSCRRSEKVNKVQGSRIPELML